MLLITQIAPGCNVLLPPLPVQIPAHGAGALFAQPLHPYTQALFASVPDLAKQRVHPAGSSARP